MSSFNTELLHEKLESFAGSMCYILVWITESEVKEISSALQESEHCLEVVVITRLILKSCSQKLFQTNVEVLLITASAL